MGIEAQKNWVVEGADPYRKKKDAIMQGLLAPCTPRRLLKKAGENFHLIPHSRVFDGSGGCKGERETFFKKSPSPPCFYLFPNLSKHFVSSTSGIMRNAIPSAMKYSAIVICSNPNAFAIKGI